MKKSWILGLVSVVAVVANGCASGAEGATMMTPDGISISPVGENMVTSSPDQSLPTTSEQAVLPSAGDSIDGVAAALESAHTCAHASASSGTMATAQFLGSCVVGALTDADAGQHFVFNPEAGVDYTIQMVRGGDATFDLGVAAAGPSGERTCAAFTIGLTATRFSSDGTAGDLCVVVHSDTGAAQTFRLALTR